MHNPQHREGQIVQVADAGFSQTYLPQLRAFMEWITWGVAPPYTVEDAAKDVKVLLSIYKAAQSQEWVAL